MGGMEGTLMAFDNKGGIFVYHETTDDFCLLADIAELMGSEVLVNNLLATENGCWLAMREGVWFLEADGKTVSPMPS